MGNFLKLDCYSSTSGCGWAEVSKLMDGILKNLLVIGMFVAAVMISYAGWILFKGFGDPSARTKARRLLISVVIGCVILFSAYFIVDLVLNKIAAPGAEFRTNSL